MIEMKKKIIFTFMVLFLLSSVWIIFNVFIVDRDCNNLKRIVGDKKIIAEIWNRVSRFIDDPVSFQKLDMSSGLVYVKDIEGHLDIDWKNIQIPLRHASIEFRGPGLSYRNFDRYMLQEVRVGYGYRKQIVFEINHKQYRGKSKESYPSSLFYSDVSISCRN